MPSAWKSRERSTPCHSIQAESSLDERVDDDQTTRRPSTRRPNSQHSTTRKSNHTDEEHKVKHTTTHKSNRTDEERKAKYTTAHKSPSSHNASSATEHKADTTNARKTARSTAATAPKAEAHHRDTAETDSGSTVVKNLLGALEMGRRALTRSARRSERLDEDVEELRKTNAKLECRNAKLERDTENAAMGNAQSVTREEDAERRRANAEKLNRKLHVEVRATREKNDALEKKLISLKKSNKKLKHRATRAEQRLHFAHAHLTQQQQQSSSRSDQDPLARSLKARERTVQSRDDEELVTLRRERELVQRATAAFREDVVKARPHGTEKEKRKKRDQATNT